MTVCDGPVPGALSKRERGGRSGRGRRFELGDQAGVEGHHAVVVGVIGVLAQEVEHLPVAVGGLPAVAPRLVHHAEPVPAVVHFRVARQQRAGGGLGPIRMMLLHKVADQPQSTASGLWPPLAHGVFAPEIPGSAIYGRCPPRSSRMNYYHAARTPARAPTEPPWKEPPSPALIDQVRSIL
jgi:hypothetical protein